MPAADALDRAIDYEEAERMGAIIGSGTIEVFGSDACGVEMAADAISYLQMESCGKCVFCREGVSDGRHPEGHLRTDGLNPGPGAARRAGRSDGPGCICV